MRKIDVVLPVGRDRHISIHFVNNRALGRDRDIVDVDVYYDDEDREDNDDVCTIGPLSVDDVRRIGEGFVGAADAIQGKMPEPPSCAVWYLNDVVLGVVGDFDVDLGYTTTYDLTTNDVVLTSDGEAHIARCCETSEYRYVYTFVTKKLVVTTTSTAILSWNVSKCMLRLNPAFVRVLPRDEA